VKGRWAWTLIGPALGALAYAGCTSSDDDNAPAPTDAGYLGDNATAKDAATDGNAAEDASANDAANDAGADVWSPKAIPGLVLWLDGTRELTPADGGSVAKWTDQSGSGNNALPPEAGTGTAPAVALNGIGGSPAVHFNGTTDYLVVPDSPSLQFGTGEFIVVVVARHVTPTDGGTWGYGMLYSKQETAFPYAGPALVANTETRTGAILAQLEYPNVRTTTTKTTYNDGQPFVVAMHRVLIAAADAGDAGDAAVPAILGVRVNGADAGSTSTLAHGRNVSAAARPLYIGGTPAAQDIVGDIAEVVAIKAAIRPADLTLLESYLKAKYGM
jgi:hypothetical protein